MFSKFLSQNLFKKSTLYTKRLFHTTKACRQTLYDILRLPVNCSSRDIRAAYVKLLKGCHPDVNTKLSRKEILKIKEAYEVLSKPETRVIYNEKMLLPRKTFFERYSPPKDRYKPYIIREKYQSNTETTTAPERKPTTQNKVFYNDFVNRKGVITFLLFIYTAMLTQFLVFKRNLFKSNPKSE